MTTKAANATTTTTENFDFSIADGTNQEYVDVYPRIQWQHGSRQLSKLGDVVAHTGGLFLPADQFPNFNADGWQEDSFISSQNEEIKGWSTKLGHLAIIRVKSWWHEGEGSRTHMLCCVRGVDGIFSLQVSGISKGKPMNDAFNAHRSQIVAMVNRSKPQGSNGFEPYALYSAIEPGQHETQSSKSNSSKSSEVTKPRLYLPENIDLAYARTLFVGKESYAAFTQIYQDTAAWQLQIPQAANTIADDNAPAFTGGVPNGDGMTQGQSQMIAGLLEVKNVDEQELTEMCLTVSDGATNSFTILNRTEAAAVIDLLKVM